MHPIPNCPTGRYRNLDSGTVIGTLVEGENGNQWWQADAWAAESDAASGWTAEVSVQVVSTEIVVPGHRRHRS